MEKERFSDLASQHEGYRIIVIKPRLIDHYPPKEELLEQEKLPAYRTPEQSLLKMLYEEVLSLRGLKHDCSLLCSGEFATGEPIAYYSCGGSLEFRMMPLSPRYDWLREREKEILVTCTQPNCHMEIGISWSISELREAMFHLMLKQMVPGLPTCNYIDCTLKRKNFSYLLAEEQMSAKRIQRLGLISLIPDICWGKIKKGPFGDHVYDFSLGFMLMPGMETTEGFDGFDRWVRFLIEKKFRRLHKQLKALTPQVIGPKTARTAV